MQFWREVLLSVAVNGICQIYYGFFFTLFYHFRDHEDILVYFGYIYYNMYQKKAGLASRNLAHLQKSSYAVSVFTSLYSSFDTVSTKPGQKEGGKNKCL